MCDLDNVRVALRIRPLVQSERDRGCQEAVQHIRGAAQVTVNRMDTFTFNYVFDALDTQEQVYTLSVSDMLDKLFCGFNATILAYGQTGSGKTHTMGTAFDGQLNEHVGVIPRAMRDIFDRIEKLSGEFEFVVTCAFMELYQEQLYDLLSPQPREQSIVELRENRNGIVMQGLTEQVVKSARETTDCLVRGASGRAVAATAMNQQSSRSHAIFTVTITATKKDEMRTVTTSKFHLVDLAGSERSKKTQATGDRFKEGVKINQGLLALGNVISALGSGQGSGFVRYRDSKLTRMLQDSLGGNSITLMIACVSPADYNVQETLSTLRYADRARQIKNKPIVNQDPHAAEINHLKGIIQKLRVELLAAGGGISGSLNGELQTIAPAMATNTSVQLSSEVSDRRYQQLQEKYRNLQMQLQSTLHDVVENEMRAHLAEASHEKLKAKTHDMKVMLEDLQRDFTPDVTPAQLEVKISRLQQVCELMAAVDEELERTQSEMDEHKRNCSIGTSSLNEADRADDSDGSQDGTVTLEMHTLMQDQADAYTNKQIDFKEQLRRINRELNLKEELHQRVAGNLNKFCTLEDNVEEKFKECEAKIQELESERSELLDKLRYVKENTSAKLAEERRKRLHALEQEINNMKRKNLQQAKLLKVREKETQKIQNLHKEIQAMKESKVKLIRAMRQESENFRQWKLMREKELMQLRNKDRKLQNEMARKENLHTKQRNVLKRKCEEAMAINKRLKDALERQKVAQSQRQKMQSAKDASAASSKIDQVISWVERELEVIVSLIDAEHSLEQLMEDRGIISTRIGELQQLPVPGNEAAQERANLEEELEMRNAQITDLQQKVCAADLEARMRSLYDSISSVAEARAVLKHLLKAISDMRREHAVRLQEQKQALDEQCMQREVAEQRCQSAAKRMRLMELSHEEAIAEREHAYEEKIAVLLRELHSAAPQLAAGAEPTPEQQERLKIQEEQLNKMDTMREELDHYKQLVNELRQAAESAVRNRKSRNGNRQTSEESAENIIEEIKIQSADNELDDSCEDDPDLTKTPLYRRPPRQKCTRRKASNSSSKKDDTFATATSDVGTGEPTKSAAESAVRNRKLRNGNRQTSEESAENILEEIEIQSTDNELDDSRENDPDWRMTPLYRRPTRQKFTRRKASNSASIKNETFVTATSDVGTGEPAPGTSGTNNDNGKPGGELKRRSPGCTHPTPKLARLSTLTFETPSAKKKFFE